MEKHAILIAGPNGAGKTTFARQVLPLLAPGAVFLNADEIQHEGTQFMSPVSAGRELLRRLAGLEQGQQSFALETTTLASTMYVRRVAAWRSSGFGTAVHFIELPSADYAVERVRRRALLGGHSIPRKTSGGVLCGDFGCFRPRTSRWSMSGTIGSATTEDFDLSTTDAPDPKLALLLEAARRANWDALHGPRHLRTGRFVPTPEEGEETEVSDVEDRTTSHCT